MMDDETVLSLEMAKLEVKIINQQALIEQLAALIGECKQEASKSHKHCDIARIYSICEGSIALAAAKELK